MALQLVCSFGSPSELVAAYEQELSRNGLLVRGAQGDHLSSGAPCEVGIQVGGALVFTLAANLAAVVPGVGIAVMFQTIPPELTALVERARLGEPLAEEAAEEVLPGPLTERLKAMTVAQKISLALACDRETRFALLRDHNKTLHTFVLKNPRIGLDEVLSAAKMPSLSPEALKFIAEHKEWGFNSSVATSLVRNPKTLLPLALRLLDRIPVGELRAIAKGGARDQIVQAARKRLSS